jgi:hypothetical protein
MIYWLGWLKKSTKASGRESSMSKKDQSSLMVSLYEWAHDIFTQYLGCRPIYVQEALKEAGFQIESPAEMSRFGLPVDIVLAGDKDFKGARSDLKKLSGLCHLNPSEV